MLGLGYVFGFWLGLDCSVSKKVESNAKSLKVCGISENAEVIKVCLASSLASFGHFPVLAMSSTSYDDRFGGPVGLITRLSPFCPLTGP